MKVGRTYEVFVEDKPVGLVGSTTLTLKLRRAHGYTKRFGPTVELRLIREVPCPEGYSDEGYNILLKSKETFDIIRKNTWVKNGGLNKISPLVQALGSSILEEEMGRIGGRVTADSGQLARVRLLRTKEQLQELGRNVGRNRSDEDKTRAGQIGGRIGGRIAGLIVKERKIGICGMSKEALAEAGRKGGYAGSREDKARAGRIGGKVGSHEDKVKAGLAGILCLSREDKARGASNQPLEAKIAGGHISGRKNAENGNLDRSRCQRWNINRGKPCVCGFHT